VSVFVVDAQGNQIDQSADGVTDIETINRLFGDEYDPRFRYINRIDPYGYTTFNQIQVRDVRKELAMIVAQSDEDRAVITKIDALIDVCLSRPHLYLKFFGD
jgi:hypothetical protein